MAEAITHVVQARCMDQGWVDSKTATSWADAVQKQVALLADDSAWMPVHLPPHNRPRETRIVTVQESNCAYRYLHPELY